MGFWSKGTGKKEDRMGERERVVREAVRVACGSWRSEDGWVCSSWTRECVGIPGLAGLRNEGQLYGPSYRVVGLCPFMLYFNGLSSYWVYL